MNAVVLGDFPRRAGIRPDADNVLNRNLGLGVRLPGPPRKSTLEAAVAHVFGMSSEKKMAGVNAKRGVALMTNTKTRRYWPKGSAVRCAMGQHVLALDHQNTVAATSAKAPAPEPTPAVWVRLEARKLLLKRWSPGVLSLSHSKSLHLLRGIVAITFLSVLAGCATRPVTVVGALACAGRIPPQLADSVPGPDLPSGETVGDWIAFADATAGKLDQSNDEKATVLWIVRNCESEQARAAESLKPRPFWRFWR